MPLISFVIAVYNNETYLSNAVYSVTKQKIEQRNLIEVIIVDDGSTDNTAVIADGLSEKDDRIKVIHQENQWIYASFNNGIKIAEGEYIYILNSDDKLFDGSAQMLLDCIEHYNHPDVVWTKVIWQNVDKKQDVIDEHDMNIDVVNDEYIDSIEMVHNRWSFIQTSGLAVNQANLYKRELAIRYPFRNDYYAADSFFNIRIADDIKKMVILSTPIYRYLSYSDENYNASIGKYYGYEHIMFNELMMEEIKLYEKWQKINDFLDFVVAKRLKELSYEIDSLAFDNCKISNFQKFNNIFNQIADFEIRKISSQVGREREYESRILTGTKKLVERINYYNDLPEFIKILIDNLPDYYLDNVDLNNINKNLIMQAVNDNDNVDKIGKIYYSESW